MNRDHTPATPHLSRITAWALAVLSGLALAACGTERAEAASLYYVSAKGNDNASGKTVKNAWRTVQKVNRTKLRPGDKVVFRAGDTFRGNLSPTRSGRRGKPILYSSFGRGRAKLPDGVFLRSVSHVHIDELHIDGAGQGIAGSSAGGGAKDITITRNLISDVRIGINAPNPADARWRIRKNRIVRTGDSAIIILGSGVRVRDNFIAHSGRDRSISYGKHGIYAKGPGISVIRNRIIHFADEGVSTRFRNARILGNIIRHGPGGIAYYRNDSRRGTTYICRNSISDVDYGIYLDPDGLTSGSSERFRINRNHIHNPGGTRINTPSGLRSIELRGNTAKRSLALLRPSCA